MRAVPVNISVVMDTVAAMKAITGTMGRGQ
jgi:hypothetical protein